LTETVHKKDKRDEGLEGFTIDLMEILRDTIALYSKILKAISVLQEKYPDAYDNFCEIQKSPNKLMEAVGDMDYSQAQSAFQLLKIIVKFSTIENKLRFLWSIDEEKQKALANEINDFVSNLDDYTKKLKSGENGFPKCKEKD